MSPQINSKSVRPATQAKKPCLLQTVPGQTTSLEWPQTGLKDNFIILLYLALAVAVIKRSAPMGLVVTTFCNYCLLRVVIVLIAIGALRNVLSAQLI